MLDFRVFKVVAWSSKQVFNAMDACVRSYLFKSKSVEAYWAKYIEVNEMPRLIVWCRPGSRCASSCDWVALIPGIELPRSPLNPGAGSGRPYGAHCTLALTDALPLMVNVHVLVLLPPLAHAPDQIASRSLLTLKVIELPVAKPTD